MKILILILFITSQIFAQQSIDSIIYYKTNKLKFEGIEDFFYFETYCNGGTKIVKLHEEDCSIENSNIYIFWRNKNKDFLQQVSNCEKPVYEISNKVIDFYTSNINKFELENVKRYEVRPDSIVANKKYSFLKMVNHSCFKNLHFYFNSTLVKKSFDEFDLTNDKKDSNINYQFNKSLKLVILAEMCEKTIKKRRLK
jgi:hypothetical protein